MNPGAHGRFPEDEADLSPAAVGHLAAQLGVGADALDVYGWAGRAGRRHRRLTPLVWGHVSLYGAFDLDMEPRSQQ